MTRSCSWLRPAQMLAAGVAAALCSTTVIASPCPLQARVQPGTGYVVAADGNGRALAPSHFGFSLAMTGFHESFEGPGNHDARQQLIRFMRAFPGALYRYGTNGFDWQAAVGPYEKRPRVKLESWAPPDRVSFGPAEYLSFLQDVQGLGWYVANLSGTLSEEWPVSRLSASASGLAAFLREKEAAGLPRVVMWELGNELDRPPHNWPATKLARTARAVTQGIRQAQPGAPTALILQEYPAQARQGYTAERYNAELVREAQPEVNQFLMHLYYDNGPKGVSVPDMLDALCKAAATAQAGAKVGTPFMWISEHAKAPDGAWDAGADWRALAPRTTDLESALSAADMFLASTQIPAVGGAILHSVHASSGPWPLFHKGPDGLRPTAVYLGLRVLRESLLPRMLATTTTSLNRSNYRGGYDLRAAVLRSEDGRKLSVWIVNRDSRAADVSLQLPFAAGRMLVGQVARVHHPSKTARNLEQADSVRMGTAPAGVMLDGAGRGKLIVSGYSVNAFSFDVTSSASN